MLQDTNKTILIFTINGINSLLGWNAVLAALDYFAGAFKDYNIYSFLPIPLFVGYILIGLTYHMLSNKFKYVNLIIIGNILINLSLLAILIVSIAFDQSFIGFLLLLFSSFMIGIGSNLSQITFFAMINYLSQDVVSKFTVGTAVSGLFITTIRIIILAIAGAGDKSVTPIIIYFVIAMGFNTFDLFLNIHFCKSSVYKEKIDKFLIKHDE
jgi:MFS family permease